MSTIFVPAEPYPKKANDNIRSSDWNAAINEVSRLSVTTQNLNQNTFNGPLTINGALTASGGLTVSGAITASGGINGPLTVNGALTVENALAVTGAVTANGALTVSGALTASGGINAPLTIKGTVENALTIEGSLVKVRGVTTIGTDTYWSWSSFGCNLWARGNNDWQAVNSSQPGVCLYMGTASAGNKEFRFVRVDANVANRLELASIGTGGLTVAGGINGPITVKGDLTIQGTAIVDGSFMSVSETTVLATNASGGPWASFGSNAYYRANGWKLAKTNEAGVCLRMSGQGGGNSEFRFARVEANSTSATDLATIGRDGLTVAGGINGPITVKGVLKVGSTSGMLEVGSLTIISQNTAGSWAVFGKNFYLADSGWLLKDTSKPGVNLHMSADGADNQEFRFARRASSTAPIVHLATIGTEGIVSNGKKVATGHEFLYMIRGKVEADANASVGTGFTATRIATGLYQINFNPPFSNWPIVVATQVAGEGNSTLDNALIVGVGFEWAKIKVGDGAGTATNRAFNFIAVGPRN